MFMTVRCSIVRLCFAFFVLLSVNSLPTLSCKDNQDCVNGYCQKETCICNKGWWGNSCEYCRLRLRADQGEITDGETKYQVKAKCSWLVESNKPNSTINLQFEQFATECTWDHLYVYDGKSIDDPLIAALSGQIRDSEIEAFANGSILELHTKSGAAFLYFYSDKNFVLNGFNIKYSIIPDCSVDCGSHGYCNSSGMCSCHAGWTGERCDIATCPAACVHGVCNQQLRWCMCLPQYRGASCDVYQAKSVWSQYVSNNQDVVQGRASHAAGHLADHVWVYGGYPLNKHPFNDLVRYNVKENSWEVIAPVNSSDGAPVNRYGHSLVVFNNSLFVFGGRVSEKVVNELWAFDTTNRQWSLVLPSEGSAEPLPVAGHTATLVDQKLIVLFGYGNADGFNSKVQEFDLVTRTWSILSVDYSMYRGTFGHSSVYHPAKKLIYVYGGFRLKAGATSDSELSSELTAYDPFNRKWFALSSNTNGRFLHSAALVGNLMLVFGGNEHQDPNYSTGRNTKCYANYFQAYDIRCDKWYRMPQLGLHSEDGRYGHSALVLNRTMFVFGGFRGTMMNDVLAFSLGDCSSYKDKTSCLAPNETLPCVWSTMTNTCEAEPTNLPLAGSLQKRGCPGGNLCQYQENCSRCLSSPHGCEWCGKKCVRAGKCNANKRVGTLDNCPAHKKTACADESCKTSCYNFTSCETCVSRGNKACMWCESMQLCVETASYVISFPYGQCHAWNAGSCEDLKCSDQKTCQDCHTLPGCGWCDDGSGTGLGRCVEGGDDGPVNRTGHSTRCPSNRWYFVECPDCQCNGHSTCTNVNICNECKDNTEGPHCDRCKDKLYGDPKNGGLCKPCQCNGHAETCERSSGDCDCQEDGVTGHHCDTCESKSDRKITGNATNGGHCYYVLSADYNYRFGVNNKTQINFQNVPENDDIDVTVDVEIETGEIAAKVKLTWFDDDSAGETVLFEDKPIGKLEDTLSHNDLSFGGPNRLTLRAYVYDIQKSVRVKISIMQRRPFLIMNFFITFFGCFFSLLFVVTVAWKIKVRYANYVMSQRRMVEMKQMASRPFSKVAILLAAPGDEDEESEESTDTTNTPTSIAFQPFDTHSCAMSSVLVRLPTDENGHAPLGQGGICCASAIVTHGEACSAHAQTGTRTPRKPIKHRLMRTCLT